MPRLYQGGLAPWQKRRILELLEQHLDGDLRLSRLAVECGLSISHLARSFKKSFGVSIHRYLIAQRVETAKELLLHSRKTLPEIALQTGFSDQAAFSRTFGAVVGKAPRRWQNEFGRLLCLPGGTSRAPDVDAVDELFASQSCPPSGRCAIREKRAIEVDAHPISTLRRCGLARLEMLIKTMNPTACPSKFTSISLVVPGDSSPGSLTRIASTCLAGTFDREEPR
jgi:AraC-like DNA-binding protein